MYKESTSQSRIRSTAPLPRGASGEEVKFYGMPRPLLGRSNGDDRRQWRKQGVAVGAAASRMQATAKQTLGAATRPWRAAPERARPGQKNRRTAISSPFVRAKLSPSSRSSGGVLALSVTFGDTSPKGRGIRSTESKKHPQRPAGRLPMLSFHLFPTILSPAATVLCSPLRGRGPRCGLPPAPR